MNQQKDITIVYNKFCPYAQRALIVAIEKDLKTNLRTVSLGEKQPFFKETYAKSLGKNAITDAQVPILIHGDKIMTQSELVCWYMAQTFQSGSNLIPHQPLKRFKMRLLINRHAKNMIDLFNKAKTIQFASIEQFQKQVEALLRSIEDQIEGRYFLGDEISLADTLIYPWFERWIILEHYIGVKIDQKFSKIKSWLSNMESRKSIIETKKLTNNQYYIQRSFKMMNSKL